MIFIVAVLFAGLLALSYAPNTPFNRGGTGEADLATLRVGRNDLIDSTIALGTVKPQVGAEVKVGSQLSGVVASLEVEIGDRVEKGELLATLRDAEWRARVEILEAELAAAIAETTYVRDELARYEKLEDLRPQLQLEDARRNLKVHEATIESTRARLAEARIMLGYTVIRAPMAGTIASVSTYEGETVAASLAAPTFVTIVDLERLEVQAYVDETDIGKVFVGQDVTFRVDAFADQELAGKVQAIYPKAQLTNNVVTYLVLISIKDSRGLLIRPEMTAHVSFILEQREDVLSIPRKSLLRRAGQNYVIVRQADGWVERPVEIGLATPRRIEIVSGLEGGETIAADKQDWIDSLEEQR